MRTLINAFRALFPKPVSIDQRLSAFPTDRLPLAQPAEIRWNAHQVPYIFAETDEDLFTCLGLAHQHLRAGQIAILRQIAQGRLSEIGGPFANKIDHGLRILDLGKAAKAIVSDWPATSRRLASAFVAGMNCYQERCPRPPELALLGLTPEPWTQEDLVTVGRLASIDINWMLLFGALKDRRSDNWAELWRRTLMAGGGVQPNGEELEHLAFEADGEMLSALLADLSKSGSNSLAIGPTRSASGAPMIANDPHLGLNLPNLWLLAGIKSPSFRAVGMMLPGLPFLALGRNEHVAWGGTNARALSSDLVDISELKPSSIDTRVEIIKNRFWPDRKVEVRNSEHGPIISDSPLVDSGDGETLALKWVGHAPSDEMTAFLEASKATDLDAFRSAMGRWGVSAMNVLVVDHHGRIGKMMAAHLPLREGVLETDLVKRVKPGERLWAGVESAADMPFLTDPDEGFIASANDRPDWLCRFAGIFFSPRDRVCRMAELVDREGKVDLAALMRFHRDVTMPTARSLSHVLAGRLSHAASACGETERERILRIAELLSDWDGSYSEDSRGALAFELVAAHLGKALYAHGNGSIPSFYGQWGAIKTYLITDLDAQGGERRQEIIRRSALAAADKLVKLKNWGGAHRIRVGHLLANLPIIGRFFVLDDLPASGSRETLQKRSHGPVFGRHRTTFGAQARHISDLSDPDSNWFVLFGGQDGWIGSENYVDQLDPWRRGAYIQLPLTRKAVEKSFIHEMMLSPG